MHCSKCGMVIGEGQSFCQNCGTPVNGVSSSNVVGNANPAQGQNVQLNNPAVPSGFGNSNVNVNQPSDIGFGGDRHELEQVNANQPVINNNAMPLNQSAINPNTVSLNQPSNTNPVLVNTTKNTSSFDDMLKTTSTKRKRKSPWLVATIILLVVMFGGLLVWPFAQKHIFKTYDSENYSLKYNLKWSVDKEKDDMTLYYSDKNSRFVFNAVSTYSSLNFEIKDEEDRKKLYKAFYKAWSSLDGGELTGGTDTFIDLNEDTMYARVDYKLDGRSNIGAFYVVVSQKYNKVISFMSYCTEDNWKSVDLDVVAMLDSITYRSKDDSKYKEFVPGDAKQYMALGYMNYKVPDCWSLDDELTKSRQYTSNVFRFKDGKTLLDIKAMTPSDYTTGTIGTTYEKMKSTIETTYGGIVSEKTKNYGGNDWYIITTKNYSSGGVSYHNQIYFTLSATKKNLYYLEAYVINDTTPIKSKYLDKSIEYILTSAELLKYDE